MAVPGDVFIQIGGYLLVAVFIIFFLNRALGGLLLVWLKVRGAKNRKVLLKVRTVVNDYYAAGEINEGWLVYKPRGKSKHEMKRLSIVEGCVYHNMGLNCIDVDDEKNCTVKRDFTAVPGYDAEKNNSLHLRALYKPSIIDDKTKIILVLLVLIIIGIIISVVVTVKTGGNLMAEIESLKTVTQGVGSIIPRTGAV